MYGLVNQAIEDLVTQNHGKEIWNLIREEAKIKLPFFQGLVNYDDQITYDLIRSTGLILALTQEEVLEAFGSFWITFTAQKGFEGFLFLGSSSLRDFILHLNDLHEKIEDLFPNYKPPVFGYENVSEDGLTLIYKSTRPGLEFMLKGLLKGLGIKFDTKIDIIHILKTEEDHAKFHLRF